MTEGPLWGTLLFADREEAAPRNELNKFDPAAEIGTPTFVKMFAMSAFVPMIAPSFELKDTPIISPCTLTLLAVPCTLSVRERGGGVGVLFLVLLRAGEDPGEDRSLFLSSSPILDLTHSYTIICLLVYVCRVMD
jgi:hypothetical protein